MNYLIDTHIALWWWSDSSQLSRSVRSLMEDDANTIYFSAISGYEIIQKHRLGKLSLPNKLIANLALIVSDEGWNQLPLKLSETLQAASYESDHRDPFDRILAAQAQMNDLVIITADKAFENFPVTVHS